MILTGDVGVCQFKDSSNRLYLAPLKMNESTTILTARNDTFSWNFSCHELQPSCYLITYVNNFSFVLISCSLFRICDPSSHMCIQDNSEGGVSGMEIPLVNSSNSDSQMW